MCSSIKVGYQCVGGGFLKLMKCCNIHLFTTLLCGVIEVDGDLVATEEADLNMLPDSSSNRHSYSNEDMSKSFSKSPPLAPILERSNGNMEASKVRA